MRSAEPELELVRRGVWFGPLAFVLALAIGVAAGGWDIGWSAAIGIAVVFTNFVVHGLSLARAARHSLTALAAVAMGGFIVRMAAIVALMFALNRLSFFSPLAFGLAVVPATLLLLAFEMKLLAGGLGAELRLPQQEEAMTS
ncbi:MAG: hypothetical protein M3N24_02335 [Actinomycetota bacterium]|nr:hypothetical protein [Actinomycetota bacterium]